MYLVKLPLLFLIIFLYFSSIDAATVNIDPSKYTVGFKFNGNVHPCLGGILGGNLLISAAGCFADHRGVAIDYKSIKAVVGSVEVSVDKVRLPKFPTTEGDVLRDYALVYLKEDLNLEEHGLTKLFLPIEGTKVNSSAVVSKRNNDKPRILKIVDSENCPKNDDNVNFIAESHLCVELPDSNDRCLDQLGAPLAVQGKYGAKYIIGVQLNCYDNSAHEVFANIYSGVEKPSEFFPPHVYP